MNDFLEPLAEDEQAELDRAEMEWEQYSINQACGGNWQPWDFLE